MGLQQADAVRQQANISKLAECLPERTNTHVPIAMIKKHSREWQAHLQQISDYIVEGEGVWWRKQNEMVEFYDEAKHPTQQEVGPLLHHFRSSNLQLEATHLDRCWKKCIGEVPIKYLPITWEMIHQIYQQNQCMKIHLVQQTLWQSKLQKIIPS